ncbi:MAG: ArsA family ATPase [Terriglobales bacterium]
MSHGWYTSPVPSLDFFIGKGGVGKTTVSSAYACWRAAQGGRVLLLSTDPAHSLFDVFELSSSRERQRVKVGGRALDVWQLRAERQFREFLDSYRDAVLDVLAAGTIFSREEVAPLLETTIPGMAEVSALLVLADLLGGREYDRIVVDTAPLGHTLRLFELPDSFLKLLRFLDVAASRDRILAQRFAGANIAGPAFLREWEKRAAGIREALAGRESRIVLVTTAEAFALNESVRAKKALAEMDPPLRVGEIVLNRATPTLRQNRAEGWATHECPRCATEAKRTEHAEDFLQRNFSRTKILMAEDAGAPIAGTASLLAFGEHVFEGTELRLAVKAPKVPEIGFEQEAWPEPDTALSLTIGKGGVGKTTISAGLGFVARNSHPSQNRARVGHATARVGHPVTICSTDPAPSLDDVFGENVGDEPVSVLGDGGLRAMEIDAAAQFRRWAQKIKENVADALGGSAGGLHVDLSFEREMITALLDMAPPGMDELSATFRILDLLEDSASDRMRAAGPTRVIIDMAPTGHALELLRMPERIQLWARLILRALAPHRQLRMAQDAAVEVAKVGQDARRLAGVLRDPKESCVYVVMLAEPLPDRETARLIRDLDGLGVHRGPTMVNRVLLQGGGRCRRCETRARFQMATLGRLRQQGFGTLLALPEEAAPVAGAAALRKFTRKLWRIV